MPKYNLHVGGAAAAFQIETDEEPTFRDGDEVVSYTLVGSQGRRIHVRAAAVVAYEELDSGSQPRERKPRPLPASSIRPAIG